MGYFFDSDDQAIKDILQENIIDAGGECVLLIDLAGNIVSNLDISGKNYDVESLASLASGNFGAMTSMAKLLGESEFSLMFHKGKKGNMHFSKFMDCFLLITIFSDENALGFLRLKVEAAKENLQEIFDSYRVFVNKNNRVSIMCPDCGELQTIDVAKYLDNTRLVKVECKCGCMFTIQLEFEKTDLKNTNLVGEYSKTDQDQGKKRMIVENISEADIGFIPDKNHNIKKGDVICVEFVMDDEQNSLIVEEVIVRQVQSRYISAKIQEASARR